MSDEKNKEWMKEYAEILANLLASNFKHLKTKIIGMLISENSFVNTLKKRLFQFSFIIPIVLSLTSCGNKEGDEPTKYMSQTGLEKLTYEAVDKASKQSEGKKNSNFFVSKEISGKSAEVRDLDSRIRPVLKKLFGDVKLVSESDTPETKIDGEIVENRFAYVASKSLVPKDGEPLHATLHAVGFRLSPRLGGKPTIWSGGAAMSLFKSTSLRSYSLVISIDTKKQQIVVESYRLGSKYDRLM